MSHDYSALAADFYINQRLNLKMDLSMRRDTVLSLFDRIRRDQPQLDRFKRYSDELALESKAGAIEYSPGAQQWVAVRKTSVRSGSVNPESASDGYRLHRLVLENAPYYLDISALDIDHLEALYGFDLMAGGNHDAIVFNALYGGSALESLVTALEGRKQSRRVQVIDCQPLVGVSLLDEGHLQAHFEVKTRSGGKAGRSEGGEEPISVYLVVRKFGQFDDVAKLSTVFDEITLKGEELLDQIVVPKLLTPLREAIVTGG